VKASSLGVGVADGLMVTVGLLCHFPPALKPTQMPELCMTIVEPVETQTFNWGANPITNATFTAQSVIIGMIFGTMTVANLGSQIPLTHRHVSGGHSINSPPLEWYVFN
jgi:hypothetical protein